MALIAFLVPFLVILGTLSWLLWRGSRERLLDRLASEKLFSTPISVAAPRAQMLLQNGKLFECSLSIKPKEFCGLPLDSIISDFFSQYRQVKCKGAPWASLDRNALRYEIGLGLFCIGKGMENTDLEFQLFVDVHGTAIFERANNSSANDEMATYPTIWHWVLAVAGEMQRNNGSTSI